MKYITSILALLLIVSCRKNTEETSASNPASASDAIKVTSIQTQLSDEDHDKTVLQVGEEFQLELVQLDNKSGTWRMTDEDPISVSTIPTTHFTSAGEKDITFSFLKDFQFNNSLAVYSGHLNGAVPDSIYVPIKLVVEDNSADHVGQEILCDVEATSIRVTDNSYPPSTSRTWTLAAEDGTTINNFSSSSVSDIILFSTLSPGNYVVSLHAVSGLGTQTFTKGFSVNNFTTGPQYEDYDVKGNCDGTIVNYTVSALDLDTLLRINDFHNNTTYDGIELVTDGSFNAAIVLPDNSNLWSSTCGRTTDGFNIWYNGDMGTCTLTYTGTN